MLCHLSAVLTCFSVKDLMKLTMYAADLFSHQEKLAKSIHYLISKEDQVRTQITELELLINQTEVRELTHAAATPNIPFHSAELVVKYLEQSFLFYFPILNSFIDLFYFCFFLPKDEIAL